MKLFYVALIVVSMTCFVTVPASAAINDGDFGLSIDASVTHSSFSSDGEDTESITQFFGGIKASWFPVKFLEVAGRVNGLVFSSDAADMGFLDFLCDINWIIAPDSDVIPYIGGHLGASTFFSDTTSTSFAGGGQAGVLFFMDEQSSIRLEYRVTLASHEPDTDEVRQVVSVGYMFIW